MTSRDLLQHGETATAVLSACERYRFRLARVWDWKRPRMIFVMLNPSTADAATDDPTIRRCRGFAKRENCGGFVAKLAAADGLAIRALLEPRLFDAVVFAERMSTQRRIRRWRRSASKQPTIG